MCWLQTASFVRRSSREAPRCACTTVSASLDPGAFVAVAAPAHDRVAGVAGAAGTLARAIRDSRLPNAVVEPAFRRLARPAAVTANAAGDAGLGDAVVTRFAADVFTAPVGGPDGVTAMRPATEVIGAAGASAALAAIGDAQPDDPGRLDTVLATLGANVQALPTGEVLRAAAPANDVGAVSLVASLGAVRAGALSAILEAALPAAPPPVPPVQPPPVVGGHHPPIAVQPHQPVLPHVPLGLTGHTRRTSAPLRAYPPARSSGRPAASTTSAAASSSAAGPS